MTAWAVYAQITETLNGLLFRDEHALGVREQLLHGLERCRDLRRLA